MRSFPPLRANVPIATGHCRNAAVDGVVMNVIRKRVLNVTMELGNIGLRRCVILNVSDVGVPLTRNGTRLSARNMRYITRCDMSMAATIALII